LTLGTDPYFKRFIYFIAAGYFVIAGVVFFLRMVRTETPHGAAAITHGDIVSRSAAFATAKNKITVPPQVVRKPIDVLPEEHPVGTELSARYRSQAVSATWSPALKDKSTGDFAAYNETGFAVVHASFVNNAMSRDLVIYYPDSETIAYKEYFKNGNGGENFSFYYPSGALWLEHISDLSDSSMIRIMNEDGTSLEMPDSGFNSEQTSGYFNAFKEDGSVSYQWAKTENSQERKGETHYLSKLASGMWVFNQNNFLHGQTMLVDENQNTIWSLDYVEGHRSGIQFTPVPDNELRFEWTWDENHQLTHFNGYYADGLPWFELNFTDPAQLPIAVYDQPKS